MPLAPAKLGPICPLPFARMEIGRKNQFIPCCDSWLTDEYFHLETGTDPWNGPAALELRRRILAGDYSLCRRELCHTPLVSRAALPLMRTGRTETQFSLRNIRAIVANNPVLPDPPSSIAVNVDPRCNLACPSCRPAKITTLTPQESARLDEATALIDRAAPALRTLKLSSDGEVLFSPWLRETLKRLTREKFPKLRHVLLHTNGLFLNAETLERLKPGSDLVRKVWVSIDAGDAATYARTRGGDWETLVRNLQWAGEQRRAGRFSQFSLLYVVRAANFRSMPDALRLAERVGADRIRFSSLVRWPRMGIYDYAAEAVHLPKHKDHKEFTEICAELRKSPIATLAIAGGAHSAHAPWHQRFLADGRRALQRRLRRALTLVSRAP